MENKTLHIIRHGKSTWEYEKVADIDRPLSERGVLNAIEMATRFRERYPLPNLVLSSPASRALHTAIIYMRELKINFNHLQVNPDIYYTHEEEMIRMIKNLPRHMQSVMLFGHNPTFTELATIYSPNHINNIPTAGIVSLTFDIDQWNEITPKRLISSLFDFPKNK